MKQQTRWFLPVCAVIPAVILFFLRRWQLATAFDSRGIPLSGATSTTVLLLVLAAVAVCWLLCSRRLAPCTALGTAAGLPAGLLLLCGGVAIGGASLLALYHHVQLGDSFAMLADGLGLAAAFCLCVDGGLQLGRHTAHPGFAIVPYIFLMLRLVVDFRAWSSDPVVLDYCFRHFGLIFSLAGLYLMASFRFCRGRRRLSAFFTLGAVSFCAAALPGVGTTDLLLYGGLCLTMLAALCRLAVPAKA